MYCSDELTSVMATIGYMVTVAFICWLVTVLYLDIRQLIRVRNRRRKLRP
jgi:uncharacterized membrane protein (DUF2068 family)